MFHKNQPKLPELSFDIEPIRLNECEGIDRVVLRGVDGACNTYFVSGADRTARSVRVVFRAEPSARVTESIIQALKNAGLRPLE